MSDLFGAPFRGDPSVPHVSEDYFKMVLVSANAALVMLSFPGRFLGTEARPRKFNPDYIVSVCNENAQKRDMLRGKVPTDIHICKPVDTNDSHEKKWYSTLQKRRWAQERMGPAYPPT